MQRLLLLRIEAEKLVMLGVGRLRHVRGSAVKSQMLATFAAKVFLLQALCS
jgi:hypothetical protein